MRFYVIEFKDDELSEWNTKIYSHTKKGIIKKFKNTVDADDNIKYNTDIHFEYFEIIVNSETIGNMLTNKGYAKEIDSLFYGSVLMFMKLNKL